MKCAVHADVDATGYCRNCGKALCPECTRDVRGALYCESCLAGLVGAPPAAAIKGEGNPGLAATLGIVPGLGAVYNGEYIKALLQVLIFGAVIALLNSDLPGAFDAFLGVGLGCFYCYMPIDAYRVARARRAGEPVPSGPLGAGPGQKPIGAIVLIVLGILFLLANFGLLREEWFSKTWPVGLIGLGVYLLWTRMGNQS